MRDEGRRWSVEALGTESGRRRTESQPWRVWHLRKGSATVVAERATVLSLGIRLARENLQTPPGQVVVTEY